jgi:hypothetical protein
MANHEPRKPTPATPAELAVATPSPERRTPGASAIPPLFDTWEVDEQLRHIGRVLNIETPEGKIEPARIDPPHKEAPHAKLSVQRQHQTRSGPRASGKLRSLLAWTAICLGTMFAVCGSVLMIWSFNAARLNLWDLGLPMAIAGAIALLSGATFQWARAGRIDRAPAQIAERIELSRDRSGRRNLIDGGGPRQR